MPWNGNEETIAPMAVSQGTEFLRLQGDSLVVSYPVTGHTGVLGPSPMWPESWALQSVPILHWTRRAGYRHLPARRVEASRFMAHASLVERIDGRTAHPLANTKQADTEYPRYPNPHEPCHDRGHDSGCKALVVIVKVLARNDETLLWRYCVSIQRMFHRQAPPVRETSSHRVQSPFEGKDFLLGPSKLSIGQFLSRSNSLKTGRSRQFIVELLPARGAFFFTHRIAISTVPLGRAFGSTSKQPEPRKSGWQVPLVPVSGCG